MTPSKSRMRVVRGLLDILLSLFIVLILIEDIVRCLFGCFLDSAPEYN